MVLHTIFNTHSQDCFLPIDLSDNNLELTDELLKDPILHEQYINNSLKKHNKLIAFGGYLEHRNLYKRSKHFNQEGSTARNIHLGVDCWSSANTPLYACLNGVIHSFNDNKGLGNYGPTIILKHEANDNSFFYTLYGHLSRESLKGLTVGKKINIGDKLADLGDHTVNGNYAPHLHFQVIKNIADYKGDYPGVCNKEDLNYYKINCPNPLTFF